MYSSVFVANFLFLKTRFHVPQASLKFTMWQSRMVLLLGYRHATPHTCICSAGIEPGALGMLSAHAPHQAASSEDRFQERKEHATLSLLASLLDHLCRILIVVCQVKETF